MKVVGQEVKPDVEYLIITSRRDGLMPAEIAESLDIPVDTVKVVLRGYSELARKENEERRREAFVLAADRIEYWYAKVRVKTEDAGESGDHETFFNGVKLILTLLSRQAAMFALDDNMSKLNGGLKGKGNSAGTAWWDDPNVSPDRLVAEAKRQGLRIPEPFAQEFLAAPLPLS